jgi:hypothetical protein
MTRVPGLALMEKSGGMGFTTSVTVVLCATWLASVPVMVSVYVPVGVVVELVTVRVEFEVLGDDIPNGLGLKVPLAPVGKPLILKVKLPLYPFKGVPVTVYCVLAPCMTVCEAGEADTEKSAEDWQPGNLSEARRVLQAKLVVVV